ncbi:MAG: tubulin-like doman-containing protein [Zavarzinella sp.]
MNWLKEPDSEPIPGYRLIKPLGSGGFGEVWLCEAPGKIFKAIKFVFGNLDSSSSSDGRAKQEFSALQRVKFVRHPFVISIERIDIVAGEVAIVMELAEKSLHEVLKESTDRGFSGIPRHSAIGYIRDAAEGLDYLSLEHHLLHLDVKPRNLFVVGGHVKVADFGLAKHLERQSAIGIMAGISPQYSAPETFTSRITKFSDQYSLAVVYLELITGHRAFRGKTVRELALHHTNNEPDLSGLSQEDTVIVAKALSKDPFKRFNTCIEFVEALSQVSVKAMAGFQKVVSTDASVITSQLYEDVPGTIPLEQPEPITGFALQDEIQEGSCSLPIADEVSSSSKVSASISEHFFELNDFEDGSCLRPTLIIGLGTFGKATIQSLTQRLADRFGDIQLVPCYRFLNVDTGSDNEVDVIGQAPRANSVAQTVRCSVQSVTRYRNETLERLYDWIPREKLNNLPKSSRSICSRAYGRLALSENYLKLITRCRQELKSIIHPEAIARATDYTGLEFRDTRPRVMIIAAASGTTSGMLVDIGYAIQNLLDELKFSSSPHCLLYCGAPDDPAMKEIEAANIVATLTELNHFSHSKINYHAKFGGLDGPEVQSKRPPFQSVYLTKSETAGSVGINDAIAKLSSFLALDLTTPLGMHLDPLRSSGPHFRSMGLGNIWYPKGLLLRRSARILCERMIATWTTNHSRLPKWVDELCHRLVTLPGLDPNSLISQLSQELEVLDQNPIREITGLLNSLQQSMIANKDHPAIWAEHAYQEMMSIVGVRSMIAIPDAMKTGRLNRYYTQAVSKMASLWASHFGQQIITIFESNGQRVTNTEGAIARLVEFCERSAVEAQYRLAEATPASESAFAAVQSAFESCTQAGQFRIFAKNSLSSMKRLHKALEDYANCRQIEESWYGISRFFNRLKSAMEDDQRAYGVCRQRLTTLRGVIETSHSQSNIDLLPTNNTVTLLPGAENNLEWAAITFVDSLTPDQIELMEDTLQSLILLPKGGLYGACQINADGVQQLAESLVDQTAVYLHQFLTQKELHEFSNHEIPGGWKQVVIDSFEKSIPDLPGSPELEQWFFVIPDHSDTQPIEEIARHLYPGVKVARSPRGTEIAFYKEQILNFHEISNLTKHYLLAYLERSAGLNSSPHARFDVLEWLPLSST